MAEYKSREWYREQVEARIAEIARAVLARNLSVIAAARELASLLFQLDDRRLDGIREICVAVHSETEHLPLGEVRNLWARDALAACDRELSEAEAGYSGRVTEACRELLVLLQASAFDDLWSRHGRREGISPELEPAARTLYEALLAEPVSIPDVREALARLLTFLASPEGRTDANCMAIDYFLCLGDFDLPDLPRPIEDVLGDMAGALHDTVSAPEIALNFESTPEQLLARLRGERGGDPDEPEYDRSPAATRIRDARDRVDLSAALVASTIGVTDMGYHDLEAYEDEAFTTISLDQLGRLATCLEITPAEIVGPSGRAASDPIPMEHVISAIEEQRRDRSESVEQFSERVGWDVASALRDPQQAWYDWNVDCLQDVCRAVGIDWVRMLASWVPKPASSPQS